AGPRVRHQHRGLRLAAAGRRHRRLRGRALRGGGRAPGRGGRLPDPGGGDPDVAGAPLGRAAAHGRVRRAGPAPDHAYHSTGSSFSSPLFSSPSSAGGRDSMMLPSVSFARTRQSRPSSDSASVLSTVRTVLWRPSTSSERRSKCGSCSTWNRMRVPRLDSMVMVIDSMVVSPPLAPSRLKVPIHLTGEGPDVKRERGGREHAGAGDAATRAGASRGAAL